MNSENESIVFVESDKYSAVLLDVAGTTTSLTFIKETLFKFAVDHAASFLKENWEVENVKEGIKQLEPNVTLELNGAIEKFQTASEENSTNIGFKVLQGLIYEQGYQDKTLKAHVFTDVPKAISSWSKNKTIAIYSTGSVRSQKLLFANTTEGDLSAHISQYFDQNIGKKTDSTSYGKIAKNLKLEANAILFVSDDIEELKAAEQAGLATALIKRDGKINSNEDTTMQFPVIQSLDSLFLENSSKRKNEDGIDAKQAPPAKVVKTDSKCDDTADLDAINEKELKVAVEVVKPEQEAMEVTDDNILTEKEEKNVIAGEEKHSIQEDTPKDSGVHSKVVNIGDVPKSPCANSKQTIVQEAQKEMEIVVDNLQEAESVKCHESEMTKSATNKTDVENLKLKDLPTDKINNLNVEQNDMKEVNEIALNEENTKTGPKKVKETNEEINLIQNVENSDVRGNINVTEESNIKSDAETKTVSEVNLSEGEVAEDKQTIENAAEPILSSGKLNINDKESIVDPDEKSKHLVEVDTNSNKSVEKLQLGIDSEPKESEKKNITVEGHTSIVNEKEASEGNHKEIAVAVLEEAKSNNVVEETFGSETLTNDTTKNAEVNGKDENSEKLKISEEREETDIKVSKLEMNVDSPAVSVEV